MHTLFANNAFDWVLKDAVKTGSAWCIAKLLLWLHDQPKYPNSSGLDNLDETRLQWAQDLINGSLVTRKTSGKWIEDGQAKMAKIKKLYGKRK